MAVKIQIRLHVPVEQPVIAYVHAVQMAYVGLQQVSCNGTWLKTINTAIGVTGMDLQGVQSDIGAHIKHSKKTLASALCRNAIFVLFENGLDPEGFLLGDLNDMALILHPDFGSHHRRRGCRRPRTRV